MTAIPEGYMQNGQGHLVPIELVSEMDKERDALVMEMVTSAKELQEVVKAAKVNYMAEIGAFCELSAEKYDVKWGGEKGNVQLTSFDGKFKVQLAMADKVEFDERLQVAQKLMYECMHEWTSESNANVRALIENAFAISGDGKVSPSRILSLVRIQIEDARWKKAVQAIQDSIQVMSTKPYVRIFEKDGQGKYQRLDLDFSAL